MCYSIAENKIFVSLKKSLCFFWMRGHFKGEVKFSKILRGVAHKEGVWQIYNFFFWGGGGVGKKGWGQYCRVGLIPWRTLRATFPSHQYSTLGSWTCEGLLFVAYFSWLSRHPVFWFTPFPTQPVRLPLVTYLSLCSTCVTYRHYAMPLVTRPFPQTLTQESRAFR